MWENSGESRKIPIHLSENDLNISILRLSKIYKGILFFFSLIGLIGLIVGWQTAVSPLLSPPQPLPTLASTASLALYQTQAAVQATTAPQPSPTITTTAPATAVPSAPTPSYPTATTTPLPTPTVTGPPATATTTPSPTPLVALHYPSLSLTSGQPQGYLDKIRLFAYYGSPTGPGLGILGNLPRPDMLKHMRQTIANWQPFYGQPLLATYHLVTTVANPHPPTYRHQVALDIIQNWIESAKADGVVVILDIQPGRANIMEEYGRIRQFLYEPHVHLAIDPEFVMWEDQIPLIDVGQILAQQINEVQADMNEIGYEIGLNRVLIVHQFVDSMIPDKHNLQAYPFVELLINGDGVGPPAAKIRNYNQYATEAGFEYGGFKLFPTDGDNPVMSPEWVIDALAPQPVLIIIQ